mgnify:FL=1
MVILMELVSPSGRWAGVFYHSSPKTPTAYDVSLLVSESRFSDIFTRLRAYAE